MLAANNGFLTVERDHMRIAPSPTLTRFVGYLNCKMMKDCENDLYDLRTQRALQPTDIPSLTAVARETGQDLGLGRARQLTYKDSYWWLPASKPLHSSLRTLLYVDCPPSAKNLSVSANLSVP